jgi:hypothetical protein
VKKSSIYSSVLTALMLCSLGLVIQASSQSNLSPNQDNLKVIDYSWYFDSIGGFHIVGEIQNTGTTILNPVVIGGTIYTPDGTAQTMSNPCTVYINYMLPQQKAAFLMDFPLKDMSWLSLGIDHTDFTVIKADSNSSYQYPDLSITSSTPSIDEVGQYWVSGKVQNVGNRTANNIRVIGAFYNSTGDVVATGYSEELTPLYLDPSGSASFKVGAWDINMTEITPDRKISSYTLYVQALGPLLSGTAPPPTSTSGSSSNPPPSSDDSSSDGGSSNPEASGLNYAAIVAVVVIVIIVAAVLLYKRNSSKVVADKNAKSKAAGKRESPRRNRSRGG